MSMKPKTSITAIPISEFKAKALKLLSETARIGRKYVITRKGLPIARVIPFQTKKRNLRDSLQGLARIHGDIIYLDTSKEWEANQK